MTNNHSNSVTKYIILVPVVALILLSTVLISIVINAQKYHLEDDLNQMKNTYLDNQKDLIKDKVNQAISLIDYKLELNDQPKDLVKKIVTNRLSKFRYGEKGYIYVVNKEGKLLSHRNENIIGTNAFSIKDINNKYYMKDGYNQAKKNGDAFIEYISVTNTDTTWNKKKKLTYVKYYPRYDWTISAGVYIGDMNKIISTKIETTKNEYKEQNRLLIFLAIITTLSVVTITIILARDIASKLNQTNKILYRKVDEKTKELQENLAFMNKLLNIMPLPVFIKDEEFRYIKCNDAFCNFLNLSKDEIIGKSVYDLAPTDLANEYHKKDLELVDTEKQIYIYEVEPKGDEEKKIVEFNKTSFQNNNKFAGIIGIIIDITLQEKSKLKLQEKVFNKTMQNIEQTKMFEEEQQKNIKFTAIGQLAAGITHEINTPLTYIKGNFEMIKYDILDLPDNIVKVRMLEDSQKVIDGINRLSNIVESMREMSQKSKESKEDVNIYHTLITSLTLLYNRSKQISNIKVNGELFTIGFDKDKELYICCVQKQRVEQTWVIIINNALDELVKVDNFEDRLIDINIKCTKDNKEVVIKVKDNAGGIPKDIEKNIFDPFVSSKESSGMGVGLNVAKKIIEEQNGTIKAYNEDDGAVFEIRLVCGRCIIKC